MLKAYLILSAVVDFLITYCCKLIDSPADAWKPILIYPALVAACLALHLLAFILFSLTVDKDEEITNIDNSHRRFMIASLKLYFQLVRTKINISGTQLIPKDGKYLFVSNHISIYDPMVQLVALDKEKLGFVSKKENMDIAFAGRYIWKSGCLGIDRDNDRAAVKTINQAAKRISDGISAMGIYPEGYVNKSARGLLPFRNGAFKIAKKAKVPIVIATIENTREISDHLLSRHKEVFINIVKVLTYDEISALKTVEIGEIVQKIMLNALPRSEAQE